MKKLSSFFSIITLIVLFQIPVSAHECSYEEVSCEGYPCTGWEIEMVCSECGDYYYDQMPATEYHDFEETYREGYDCSGWEVTYTCTVCEEEEYETLDPITDHSYIESDRMDSTFWENGYVDYYCTICSDSFTEDLPLLEPPESGVLKIILTWNGEPEDLDSHLIGSSGVSDVHVAYDRMTHTDSNVTIALDVDVTDGFGSETIILYPTADIGTYSYYVHDFTNSGSDMLTAMAASGATVDVYLDDVLVKTFTIPTNHCGTEWNVFTYDAGSRTINDESLNNMRSNWVKQHIEYAGSSSYHTQITQGFSGALNTTLEDIKGNHSIKAYNTLDSINKILDFDINRITDIQEYEFLLAQILFSRTGVTSIENIYSQFLSDSIVKVCETLVNIQEFTELTDDKTLSSIRAQIDIAKQASQGTEEYIDALDSLLTCFESIDSLLNLNEYQKIFMASGFSFVADEITLSLNTLERYIMYIAVGEAYCKTSSVFGNMLLGMRQHLFYPSDDPRFSPVLSEDKLVSDKTILNLCGLDPSKPYDPLNIPVALAPLAQAIENYYLALESSKQGEASRIAENALIEFTEGTLDNLVDTEVETVLSLLEALPVVKEFSAIKKLFNGTQFVIDTFTGIDDRAYLGTMFMRLNCMAYIHYFTVENLSGTPLDWNTLPINSKLTLEEYQFQRATMFDESVEVYKAILSVALEYAKAYHEANLNDFLIGPIYKLFNSSEILALQKYQSVIDHIQCHKNQLFDKVLSYETSMQILYNFKCPVSITIKNDTGETIAILSDNGNTIARGYEPYFYTAEIDPGSGKYMKIALVPETYEVTLQGTGIGTMDAYSAKYTDGIISSPTAFFDIPITENTVGSFSESTEIDGTPALIVDNQTYISDPVLSLDQSDTQITYTLDNLNTSATLFLSFTDTNNRQVSVHQEAAVNGANSIDIPDGAVTVSAYLLSENFIPLTEKVSIPCQ